MEDHGIRRVPVVREGKLVGIASRADLLRAVLAPEAQDGALKDDAAILRAVLAATRNQPWVDTFWTFPDVRESVVTLYGFYRSDAARRGLRVLAEEIPGVKRVEDKMEPMPALARIQSQFSATQAGAFWAPRQIRLCVFCDLGAVTQRREHDATRPCGVVRALWRRSWNSAPRAEGFPLRWAPARSRRPLNRDLVRGLLAF